MSVIKVEDVVYVRYRAPNLDEMRGFLTDFGMTTASQTDASLFMRGHGDAPFLHWTQKGDAGVASVGFRAACIADLETLGRAVGGTMGNLEAPGGGYVLRLTDPDGFVVEVVAGQQRQSRLADRKEIAWNSAWGRRRIGTEKRLVRGPAHVERLGHYVVRVTDFSRSEAWYKEHLGLLTSDEIKLPNGATCGAFLRCDRGQTPTDHHTVALMQNGEVPGYHHSAYEVRDIDDLMLGHDHLVSLGHVVDMGIGRHLLGSQVFTYWLDPLGQRLEHWTDGDLLTGANEPRTTAADQLHYTQWGQLRRSS